MKPDEYAAAYETVMRPAQFATQCVANREHLIELPHIAEVGDGEAFTELCRQSFGQIREQILSIFGAFADGFRNLSPNFMVHVDHGSIFS